MIENQQYLMVLVFRGGSFGIANMGMQIASDGMNEENAHEKEEHESAIKKVVEALHHAIGGDGEFRCFFSDTCDKMISSLAQLSGSEFERVISPYIYQLSIICSNIKKMSARPVGAMFYLMGREVPIVHESLEAVMQRTDETNGERHAAAADMVH